MLDSLSMNARQHALAQLRLSHRPPPLARRRPGEVFGELVFNERMMRHYLSKDVYDALRESIDERQTLPRRLAGPAANAIKAWALDRGATHFTHWFQPLTGRTAEKHDSFLEIVDGQPMERFSGDELVQQEPDASSFPSGGLRTTFEARGYTAWDCSSPIFIFENDYGKTLCIPTIFVSFTGQALDFKIPLLRSMAMLDQAATSVAQLFDPSIQRVGVSMGAEQEYFLIDQGLFQQRPDLVMTGRTVIGAAPPRGQQLDDHYFGSIPERAFAFMNELEQECHKLGIPLRTRHNEVAPSQFECAPQHESLNIAVDHGLILMDLIGRVARKHGLAALLHEKPFAGINGSGKHNNWSLITDTGKNLLSPGPTPEENLMFLAFFVCVIRAIYQYAPLLWASIASAGNDHRLGGHEAPPAILSVFIGSRLSKVLDDIENPPRRKKNEDVSELMHLGIAEIPELLLDNTDRNRTSPFAFTGNKFEFRAVGSLANSSSPMTMLNVMVAEQLRYFHDRVERKMRRGREQEPAILDMIREFVVDSKDIRFEGDGYGEDWLREAEKRRLPHVRHTPEALDAYLSEAAHRLLVETGVLSKPEIGARYEVLMQNYLSQRRIEADVLSEMVLTQVLPAATRQQQHLMENLKLAQQLDLMPHATAGQRQMVEQLGERIGRLFTLEAQLRQARQEADEQAHTRAQAGAYAERVCPLGEEIRALTDELERLLPDDQWPLPKYREMLFLH